MSEVTILICKNQSDCPTATGFLVARGYAPGAITVEQAGLITYDAAKFYDPAGVTDLTAGFVVKGVK
ncbi:MAG: hypothetical protein AAB403_16005 [Planctomycetota bacterium]